MSLSGYEMSSYVRCYAKYLREKLSTYKMMDYDFCKVKRGLVWLLVELTANVVVNCALNCDMMIMSAVCLFSARPLLEHPMLV